MTKLLALAAIAAVTLIDTTTQDIAQGATFEVTPDVAEPLLTQGVAQLADAPLGGATTPAKAKTVKVRVLMDCAFGKANDVVTLSAADAKAAEASGTADTSKEAVAYAMTLEQNQAS